MAITQPFRLPLRTLAASLALLFLFACATAPKDPSVTVAEHLQRTDAMIRQHQYPEAEEELAQALLKDPARGELYLKLGDLLQVMDEPAAAARRYRQGLARLEKDDPQLVPLSHRLALVLALKQGRVKDAEGRVSSLPPASWQRADAKGAIAVAEGSPRQALKDFNRALSSSPDPFAAAWVRYHAALAYEKLGDTGNAVRMLYDAINYSKNIALSRDIEVLFLQLQKR